MQLKPKSGGIRRSLIATSCALLGASGARSQETTAPSDDTAAGNGQADWTLDSAIAYYHENGRVQAIEPVVNLRADDGDGEIANFNFTYDSLSGSSPNGALPSNKPLGVTQIMSRQWLSEFNLSVDRFSGYLNDPYKIISVLDGTGNTTGYLYEKRPDERLRKSAFLENRIAWERASAGLALRYMSDDWHIRSETAQLRARWWVFDRELYWEPSVRWYRQSAADFYTPWITDTASPTLTYASADSRLSAFHALTYGLKYAVKLDSELDRASSEFSVRFEYYQQIIDHRAPALSALQGLDLYPGLQAILVQFGFSY